MAHALEFEQFSLPNGMNVIVVPDHRAPVVIHSVWFRAGSGDEPAFRDKKTGIAHMLEHLMFKGTDKIPPGEMSKIVARNGGQDNAFTSYDYTAYYQKVATDRLPTMMDMEADRMANLKLTDKEFQPERDVVLEERFMREESTPTSRFFEKLMFTHYEKHPYQNPIIGWREDIEGYTVQDAIDWYNTHYAPNNATMILVGDVTKKDIQPLVEKYYSDIKPQEKTDWANKEAWPTLPAFSAPKRLVKEDEEVKVPVFYRLYRAPAVFAGVAGGKAAGIKEALALTIMTEILGDHSTGRLYKALVEEQKIADAASAHYDASSRGESSIDIYIQPKPGVTLDKIEAAMEAEIKKLVDDGIPEDEMHRVSVAMKASAVYQQDDPFHVMYRLGRWLVAGGTPETFDDWLATLDTLTPEDVVNAAHTWLVESGSTTGLLVKEKGQLGQN